MMDWVGNHTAWDAIWAQKHPNWYEHDENGNFVLPRQDWTDVIALDYSNPEMRAAMLDAMTYWVKEVGVDGYRCDVAGGVPTDFWETARKQLESIKPVFMLAENEDTPRLLEKAFDMNYSWKLYKLMNRLAQGEANVQDLRDYFAWEKSIYPQAAYRMRFLTNHDENSWNGTIKERLGDTFKTFAVLIYTLPGMPLLYNGQEVGNDQRLAFFEKDPIVWKDNDLPQFYQQLNDLKANNPALWNGKFGGDFTMLPVANPQTVFAFTRETGDNKLVVAFNFSDEQASLQLSDVNERYTEYFSQEKRFFTPNTAITLAPWEYRVWMRH
jgi:glycosidase